MNENTPAEQPVAAAGQAQPPAGHAIPADQPADQPAGPAAGQGWGAPQPPVQPGQRWTLRRTLIAAGVAVAIAAAGGVAIYAASGSTDTAAQGPGQGMRMAPPGGGGGGGGPMMMFELPHGEFQTGEVTELSDSSVTVESEDGFSRTYVINDDTSQTDGIETGDTVTVIATADGDTATAASISEMDTTGGGPRQGGGPNAPQPPN